MTTIQLKQGPGVQAKFESYPDRAREQLLLLRKLILEKASELEGITEVEESLKWGEPSYKVKHGSPIRMDWKPRSPDQFALYFNCQTSLVETYKVLFGDLFTYEKNRAILFDLGVALPIEEIKTCLELALTYQKVKDKPLLGR